MRKFLNIILSTASMMVIPSIALSQSTKIPKIIKSSELLMTHNNLSSRHSAVKIVSLDGSHGSGSYIEIDGSHVIITAKHVVDGGMLFGVLGQNGESVVGEVIYRASERDIAALKISPLLSRTSVDFIGSEKKDLTVGSYLVYTGYPSSYELITATARVSGYRKEIGAILLQGFVWHGSSGAGVIDNEGNLRAVVFAIGAEKKHDHIQFLETMVFSHPFTKNDINNIRKSLQESNSRN